MRKSLAAAAAFAMAVAVTLAAWPPRPARADMLPGMKGMDHVGITVPDLGQAITFLTDVLGCSKPAYAVGPFKFDDDWMQVHLNVDPRAEIAQLAMLRCGNGSNIEVFQYNAAGAAKTEPRNSDVGGHHIAFYVEDMAAAVAYLKSKGVRMLGDPTPFAQGPIGGSTINYFLTPWGMQMELVSYPQGENYEKDGGQKLWTPKDPGH
jgi:catechol 2,3-dioxygenase-like lactoylglutathione lyase family enzyme